MKRRLPNPWISVPSLVLGLLAGSLAWVVTSVSCDLTSPIDGCLGWSIVAALSTLIVVTVGTALILVLVFQSLAEWRESQERVQDRPRRARSDAAEDE